MNSLIKLIATSGVGAVLAVSSIAASAQADGSNYHPLLLNSPDNPEVSAGAVAATRNTGSEPIGQSTSRPAMTSNLTRAEVQAEAIKANNSMHGEPIGQSTAAAISGQAPK